jgi:hypothetical protein
MDYVVPSFQTTDDVVSFAQQPETLPDHGGGEEFTFDEPCSTNDLVKVRQGALEEDFSVEQTLAVDNDSRQVPPNSFVATWVSLKMPYRSGMLSKKKLNPFLMNLAPLIS